MKAFKLPYIGTDTKTYSILYTRSGDYAVIIKCINPVLQYAADQDAYYSFHRLFTNILKLLGAGYTLQKQDIFTKKKFKGYNSNDFLTGKYIGHFNEKEYNEISTYLIITKTVKRSTFLKYDKTEFNTFIRNIGKVIDILLSHNLEPQILREAEIGIYIKRMMAFNFSEDIFSVNNYKCDEETIHMGDKAIKSLSLIDIDKIDLPETTKPYKYEHKIGVGFPTDLLSFMYSIPKFEGIIYNQVISIPDQHNEINRLQRKKQRHEAIPDPANNVSVEDINEFLNEIAKNDQLLVYGHFNMLIKATHKDQDTIINYIESSLFNIGITPSKNSYNQLELFRACLPGNSSELKPYDKFLTTGDAALCFLFKERIPQTEDSDFKTFFSDRQGIPIGIDINDNPLETGRINNRNKFVLGPSGSGKSFFMNHLVRQYYQYNMDIVIVDTGHSYSGLCSYYGGRYITYGEEKPITMNPFRIKQEEFNEEKREFLRSLIGLIWKGVDGSLSQIEDTVLANVIEAYYDDYFENMSLDLTYPSFNSFYEFSIVKINQIMKKEKIPFDIKEYAFILKKFYKGGHFDMILNDELDSTLFNEQLIVFEIDAIKEHKILFPITTIIIMDVFLQKMRHKKNRKALIIEEAWKAIASPMMASYILYLYKTVRKFWGEAIVVTQELDDIIGNEIVKDSIINNSDTICLLDQTKFKDNYDEVSRLLSLNEIEKRKIFTINNLDNKSGRGRFKEVYIKRGNSGEVYGVEVSIYEYLTYTTERKEKEVLQYYVNEENDFRKGLIAFVSDFQKSTLTLPQFVNLVHSNLPSTAETKLI